MAVLNENSFVDTTSKVIDYMEGGYFHPNMFNDGRLATKYKSIMGPSGETMFGIDRKNGISLSVSPYWKPFWKLIDDAGAAKKWKYNYRGGNLEATLRSYAAKIMYPHFTNLFEKYLSQRAQSIVANNIYLTFHFSYAAWNGPGWFQKFAQAFEVYIKGKSEDQIDAVQVIKVRTDSTNTLIRQQGNNMLKGAFPALSQKKNYSPFGFDLNSWINRSYGN